MVEGRAPSGKEDCDTSAITKNQEFGRRLSITGTPTNYTSTQWLIGATFAAGATYYLSSSWFLDFGYSFTLTDLWNQTYASPFSNTWNGFTTSGILSGSYTGNVNTHALTLSINRRF